MDSCFALIGAHQHGIAVGSMNEENLGVSKTLLTVVGSIAAIIGDEFSQIVWVYLKVW